MIDEASMARMRATQAKTFDKDCVWVRVERRQLANGRWVEEEAERVSGKARIGRGGGWHGTSAQEKEIAGRLTAMVVYTVTMPYEWDVKTCDRLEIEGRVLEVKGVILQSYATATRAVCVEIS